MFAFSIVIFYFAKDAKVKWNEMKCFRLFYFTLVSLHSMLLLLLLVSCCILYRLSMNFIRYIYLYIYVYCMRVWAITYPNGMSRMSEMEFQNFSFKNLLDRRKGSRKKKKKTPQGNIFFIFAEFFYILPLYTFGYSV